MTQNLASPGLGLPLPTTLYPTEIGALLAPYDYGQNVIDLAPATQIPIPRGTWLVSIGRVSVLQMQDPVTGIWRIHPWTYAARNGVIQIDSDGFNYRIANLTGCPVSAVVVAAGSGYPANTTVTAGGTGGSLWQPIIGGAVSISSITSAGSGYGVPPIVLIPAPPPPGVQATADAVIQSGTVASVTMRDWGAGYTVAPVVTLLPNPTDPNLLSGTAMVAAKVLATLQGSGSITAVLCTNPGQSISAVPTLTVSGTGGSGASVVPLLMQTITGATVNGAGASITSASFQGFPSALTAGQTPNTQFPNPHIDLSTFIPRIGFGTLAASGGSISSVGTVFDGGLYVGGNVGIAAAVTAQSAAGANATLPSLTATLGAVNDIVWMQPN